MNLRDLEYLVALADTRHFGRAAARCHVSQPTLSAQLKKLEAYLGVPLVERRPRRAALTPAGLAVVQRARRMLQDADDIRVLARASQDPLSGPLKVGLIPTLGPYLLPRVAPRIAKALPKLQLMLHEYQTEPLVERTLAGRQGMTLWHRDQEGLGEQRARDESARVGGQGQDREVELARERALDERLCLVLVEHELELRQRLRDARGDAR